MKVYLTLRVTWREKSRRTQMRACQSGLSHAGVRGHAWAACLMMLSGPICPSEWFEFTGPRQSNCPNH